MGRKDLEAGHPLKPDVHRQLYLDHSNISHRVKDFWWEDNILRGHVESLDTPRGRDFAGLIRQNAIPGFSLRAVGPITTRKKDALVINSPLTIFSYDWVIHPSYKTAYMEEVISEAVKAGNIISESTGLFVPFYTEKVLDYVKAQSKNFKLVSEAFGLDTREASLSGDCKKVFIKNNGDTFAIFTEDYLVKELSSYMNKV